MKLTKTVLRYSVCCLVTLMSRAAFPAVLRTIDADKLISSNHVNTLTLPATTDTVVVLSATQTLMNKTLDGSSLITTAVNFEDISDTTKQLALSLSGSTTGKVLTLSIAQTNTQTLSIPNVGSGDSLVTNATSATLTNKTISGGSNTLSQLPVATQMQQYTVAPYPNSSATTFTLSPTPAANLSVQLYLDGTLLRQGSGLDYTISGATVTMITAPVTGQNLWAVYSQY